MKVNNKEVVLIMDGLVALRGNVDQGECEEFADDDYTQQLDALTAKIHDAIERREVPYTPVGER